MKQKHTSAMSMKQFLSTTYQVFGKYLVNLSYQIFTIHQKVRKMVNFYLLFVAA